MKLIEAKKSDMAEIIQLLEESNLPVSDLGQTNQSFYILKGQNQVLAACGLEIYGSKAILRSFAVGKPLRNTGLGTLLYEKTLKEAAVRNVKELFLLTTTAESFFIKQGWKKIARENVPKSVSKSKEFSEICPSISVCMNLILK
jgi:amino-acid N-acetyltransferase